MPVAFRDGLYSGVSASAQADGAETRTTTVAPSAARATARGSREERAARKAAGLYPRASAARGRTQAAPRSGIRRLAGAKFATVVLKAPYGCSIDHAGQETRPDRIEAARCGDAPGPTPAWLFPQDDREANRAGNPLQGILRGLPARTPGSEPRSEVLRRGGGLWSWSRA